MNIVILPKARLRELYGYVPKYMDGVVALLSQSGRQNALVHRRFSPFLDC